jgi:glycosyltransferase 2 family protein
MNVGYFFNAWLPLRLGEVARAFLVTRLTPPIAMLTALSSVVVERLTDLLAVVMLVVTAVLIAPVSPEITAGARITGIVGIGGLFFLWVLANRRAWAHGLLAFGLKLLPFLKRLNPASLLDKVLDGFAPLNTLRGIMLIVLWGGLGWAASVVAGFVLMYAFYGQPTWAAALLMIAAASIAIALPAVPGSVGPFEAAIIVGLTAGGMITPENPSERAFAFAVVLHMVNVGSYALLGLFGLQQERITFAELVRRARNVGSNAGGNLSAQSQQNAQ